MKTVSCPKCGIVIDTDAAPRIEGTHKGKPQSTVQCPVCSAVVYRMIGEQNTAVPAFDDRTEEEKIAAKAVEVALAKARKTPAGK